MADKYCDHGLYGAYAATPTWGAAQDGDGTAIGEATPSTAEVVFTGIPSAGTIAVLGITLSPTWATSADVCANNLATAINASTSTATSPASFTVKSQVRNHVYARGPALGAPAGTCQIMTRQGSAAHAGLIAVTHTLNNVSSAGTINFSGGSGGAWGYLFHTASLWPSSIALGGYGLWCAIQPFTGVQADGDIVHVRANNKVITSTNQNIYPTPPATLAVNSPVYHIIGDPTVWTGDASSATLTIENYATANYSFVLQLHLTKKLQILGRKLGENNYNLKLLNTGTGLGVWGLQPGNACVVDCFNLEVTTTSSNPKVNIAGDSGHPTESRARLSNFTVKHNGTDSFFKAISSYQRYVDYENCVFDNGVAAVPNPAVFYSTSAQQTEMNVVNPKFLNFVVGSNLITLISVSSASARLNFVNPDFGNISSRAIGISALINHLEDYAITYTSFSQLTKRDFFIENTLGRVEWNSVAGQPVLSALLPDGTNKWSILISPSTVSGRLSPARSLVSPRITKFNSLSAGQRTIKLQLCISDALSWSKNEVSIKVTYPDASGNLVTLNTFDYASGALTASTVTWNQESGGKVTYQLGGTLYHNKYELSVTTPSGFDIPNGAEVSLYFSVHKSVSNSTQLIFIDPDLSIT